MRILLLSDIHQYSEIIFNSFFKTLPKTDTYDIVVIAGDITNGDLGLLKIIINTFKKPVYFVLGNHCVTADTEILTKKGWVFSDKITDKDEIGTVDLKNNQLVFEHPLKIITNNSSLLYTCKSNWVDSVVSSGHNIVFNNELKVVSSLKGTHDISNFTLSAMDIHQEGIKENLDWLRLIVHVVSNANLVRNSPNKCMVQFKLFKQYKIERLEILLRKLGIKYTKKVCSKNSLTKLKPYYIYIYGKYARDILHYLNNKKEFPTYWSNTNRQEIECILKEIEHTNGRKQFNKLLWTSTNYNDVNTIQLACIKNGYDCMYNTSSSNLEYIVQIQILVSEKYKNLRQPVKISETAIFDKTYSVTMKYGTIVTRRNGKVWVTGNCYYHRSIKEVVQYCLDNKFNLLHGCNEYVLNYNNKAYTLIGGTGWSSYNLYTEKSKEYYKQVSKECVNDFNLIYTDDNKKILPDHYETLHNTEWNFYSKYKHKENVVLITHFPMSSICLDPYYNKPEYKDLNPYFINDKDTTGFNLILSGHCVDTETEILTASGWKFRKDLLITDTVYTYNSELKCLELKPILKITDMDYTGNVYYLNNENINQRITDKHRVVGFDSESNYKVILADELANIDSNFTFLKSSYSDHLGIDLSDDLLKLYVSIVYKGHIENNSIVEFSCIKKHTLRFIVRLLDSLNIPYDVVDNFELNFVSFILPLRLNNLQFKNLDTNLLHCNQKQFKVILDTYFQLHNNLKIITSDKTEVDLFSHLSVINGFVCDIEKTVQSVSKNIFYTLSFIEKTTQSILNPSKAMNIEQVINEPFWCISVENQNFMMRRFGKVSLTGNTHTCIDAVDKYGCRHVVNAFGYGSEFDRTYNESLVGTNGFDSFKIIDV